MQASIDSFAGNLSGARQRTQHAVQMLLESNLKESAGNMLLSQATAEALLGETAEARKAVTAVIKLSNSKTEKSAAARVMALNGQGLEAQQIMDRLVRENPSDTLLNAVDAPLVLAASQLGRGQAQQVLRSLEPVKPYEFGGRCRPAAKLSAGDGISPTAKSERGRSRIPKRVGPPGSLADGCNVGDVATRPWSSLRDGR